MSRSLFSVLGNFINFFLMDSFFMREFSLFIVYCLTENTCDISGGRKEYIPCGVPSRFIEIKDNT